MADPGLWDAAQANVAVKYDPQQAALQRQLDLSSKNTASNEQSIQGYGTAGRDIIGNSFNTLYGLLGANKTDTNAALNQQLALTNTGYDQALANIRGYQQNSRDYISNMAAQLGQSGQGLVSSGKLEDSANQLLGWGEAQRTNYGSNLSDWIAKMSSLSDMGISSAHQSEALQKSGFETTLLQMLGQNKLAGTTQETDVINKIADLMNVRQSDLIDMYNQLAEAQWQHQMEQAKLDEQASEASAALRNAYDIASMQESGANSRAAGANAASAKNDDLAWAQFNENTRQFNVGQAANQAQQTTANDQWRMDYDQKGRTPGDPAAIDILTEKGMLPKNDIMAVNAWITGGPNGLQDYLANRPAVVPKASSSGGFWGTRNTGGDPLGLNQVSQFVDWMGRTSANPLKWHW